MRAASFGELHLELAHPTLMIFTAMIMRVHYELASMCLMYRYIHTNIHKYSDFLVVLISVGLAQARPNYFATLVYIIIISVDSWNVVVK